VETFAESVETKVCGIFQFAPLPIWVLNDARGESDSQGAEGVVWDGVDERGQKLSNQDVRLKQRSSVALLVSSDENWLGGGSVDETIDDR